MKIKYNGAIKASSDGNEAIVMYWDGQKVYEGPADGDMTRKIAWFLDDPEKLQEIVDYCNSFGDSVIEDTSDLMDVAATFVEMVGYELREAESIDDDVYVSDEAGHFEIFEKSNEVTGAKKSVKCSTDGNVPYDLVSMLVALRDYVDTSSAYVNDEHNKLVDIADSMYNTGLSIEEMRPEYKTIYDKYGKTFFDKVLKDVSAIDSQLTRNNLNDLIADYEDRANAFIGVEGACGSKKSVKAAEQDGNKKFRIDIYKKDNPDALIKREYKTCSSKEEAQKYGQSIADGNTVNVMEVKSSCSKRKSVRAAAVMAGPGAGYTIKWNLESINNINSFNVTNVSEPDEYGLITVEADCDVDVTVEIVEAYSYYYGIDRPINDVAAKMTKVSFEIDPDQWPELGSFYDAGVDFAAEFLNNEIYDTISNGEVMYGGGWSHSTWDGTLTDYEHDGLIEIKVTDEETIEYVDDAVSGELEGAYDDVEESKRINATKSNKRRGNMKIRSSQKTARANINSIKAATENGAKILVRSNAFVDIMEDDYEQGATGSYINQWDFDVRGEYDSAQALVDAIEKNSYVFSNNLQDYYVLDGALHTSAMVDNDNEIPSDSQIEAWKRGEETLYIADMYLSLEIGAVHDMTDDEAESFGFSLG